MRNFSEAFDYKTNPVATSHLFWSHTMLLVKLKATFLFVLKRVVVTNIPMQKYNLRRLRVVRSTQELKPTLPDIISGHASGYKSALIVVSSVNVFSKNVWNSYC